MCTLSTEVGKDAVEFLKWAGEYSHRQLETIVPSPQNEISFEMRKTSLKQWAECSYFASVA